MIINKIKIINIIILLFLFILPINAQQQLVPFNEQAKIIQKIIKYTENLGEPNVSIIYLKRMVEEKNSILGEFQKLGINAEAILLKEAKKANGNIIYIMSGIAPALLKKIPQQKRLFVSGSKQYIESGEVAFSVVNVGGKPQILVNLTNLDKSGIKVSGKLFRVAKKVD